MHDDPAFLDELLNLTQSAVGVAKKCSCFVSIDLGISLWGINSVKAAGIGRLNNSSESCFTSEHCLTEF